MAKPSVLISYSWDNETHKSWVRRLASRLVQNGVQVWLDQWHVRPGESITEFMEQKIASSGHVVVVCTTAYAKKSNNRRGGVGYEQQIISGRIAAGIARRKFIPVVKSGRMEPGRGCAIPTHFAGIYALDMRTPKAERTNFEQLLRAIYNKPKFVPPAPARPPRLAPHTAHQRSARATITRLPDWELDGWRLISGVVSNQQYPRTFSIPSEHERRNVKVGHFAKLIFDIKDKEDGGSESERMWVKVIKSDGPYFIGKLANDPSCGPTPLRFGSPIVFLPEHVIDVMSPEIMATWQKMLDSVHKEIEVAVSRAKASAPSQRAAQKPPPKGGVGKSKNGHKTRSRLGRGVLQSR